ncbi:DMT family transporter [Roseibium aggregatum]|uniref:DMT family transporter n=1 Tax=Roseibium aggregatum TaxID=187304 RepID=UPI0025ACE808|nr:DMT family transporter [Roseibium aggregatum]WJS00943.1 DMT family transporter [Roseibium aggregatum]
MFRYSLFRVVLSTDVKNLEIKYLEIKIKCVICSGNGAASSQRQIVRKDSPMVDTTRLGTSASAASPQQQASLSGERRESPLDQPLVLLLIVGGFLAVSTVIAKAAPMTGWHPLALLQWSILGGAGGLFVISRIASGGSMAAKGDTGVSRGQFAFYLLVSGLLFIAPNMIAVVAAPKVGAGFVSLSYAFPLVLTYGFAVLLRLEKFQVLRGVGVLFGLAGGILLAASGRQLSVDASWWAMFALSIPVFLASGNIFRTVKWPAGARPINLALGMMLVGFAALGLFTAMAGIPVVPGTWSLEATGLLAAQITIFAFQYGLYFRLQHTAGPVYLSQIGSVAAVIGLGLGYLAFGEVPNLAKLAAVAAVGAGIVLVSKGRGAGAKKSG